MKDHEIAESLVTILAQILLQCPHSLRDSTNERKSGDELADFILTRKMKSIYFLLGSEHKNVVASALFLLIAIVSLGELYASKLFNAFDFELPAFAKANKPSKLPPPPPPCPPTQKHSIGSHNCMQITYVQ